MVVGADLRLLLLRQLGERRDGDILAAQVGDEPLEDLALLPAEFRHDDTAFVQLLAWRAPIDAELVNAGADLLLEAADPLHEELVHIPGGDGQKLDALQQPVPPVPRLVQHAEIELQPSELAIEVKLGIAQERGKAALDQ